MQTITSVNPATEETLDEFELFSDELLDLRLRKGAQAWPEWKRRPLAARCRLMQQLGVQVRKNSAEAAAQISREMGKPIRQARAEVEKCAGLCDYYAAHAERFLAPLPVRSASEERVHRVRFDPLGTVLAVMPWNFPFWQVFRFAVPTLLAGNVGLLKHASNVCGCSLTIERLFREAEFPPGVFSSLIVNQEQVSQLIAHPQVQAVSLTGSEPAGRSVAAQAGKHLKKCVLELGGSDPFIVFEDVDLKVVVPQAVQARVQNTGQSCIAAKRFLVHRAVYDRFLEAFSAAFKNLTIGDPFDEQTELGPLARADLRDTLHEQVEKSQTEGARRVCGGQSRQGQGWFYEPTILADVTPQQTAFREETFGPLAAVTPFDSVEEAVQLANATSFGLGASLWTDDVARAQEIAVQIDSGNVFINAITKSDAALPFGGVKNSGYGRELGEFGIREFVNTKTVWLQDQPSQV